MHNTFQFSESVTAVIKAATTLGTHQFPANHPVRIRGYQTDGTMVAESILPGNQRPRAFSFPASDLNKKELQVDRRALRAQLNAVTRCMDDGNPVVRKVQSLAESLGN